MTSGTCKDTIADLAYMARMAVIGEMKDLQVRIEAVVIELCSMSEDKVAIKFMAEQGPKLAASCQATMNNISGNMRIMETCA